MLRLDSVVKVRSPVKKNQITEKIKASIYYLVLLSFLIPIGFLVYRIITLDGAERSVGFHSRADYVLMLAQCVLGLIVIHIPSALARRLRFEIPGFLYTMYIIFLYCGIFLGEVRSFYYVVPHWDDFLHASSSMMTGFFAVMVITILNRDDNLVFRISPFFVALFAFTFSVAIGALWEVYEFTGDGLLGMNMQKFITADGSVLIGHAALSDTMKDIIVDMIGAMVSSVIGYCSVKNSQRWLIPALTKETGTEKQSDIPKAGSIIKMETVCVSNT